MLAAADSFINESYVTNSVLSPVLAASPTYNWSMSTEDNHSVQEREFVGKYTKFRQTLDYTYHANYSIARQRVQDAIIDSMLNATWLIDDKGQLCSNPEQPWIVFTAGAMGSGKSWTVRHLARTGRLPLESFVTVDPDEIRKALPEFDGYVQRNREQAGEMTRKEAGFLAEIVVMAALQRGQNVLVDGSLRDAKWYHQYFSRLRREREHIRIGILHITAPKEAVFARAEKRARITGRVVPRKILEETLIQVPKSVEALGPLTDFCAELHNAPDADDLELRTEGLTWDGFRRTWAQQCDCLYGGSLEKCAPQSFSTVSSKL